MLNIPNTLTITQEAIDVINNKLLRNNKPKILIIKPNKDTNGAIQYNIELANTFNAIIQCSYCFEKFLIIVNYIDIPYVNNKVLTIINNKFQIINP